MIRVLLVDDQATTRVGLRMRLGLEPDIAVVGEAGDGCSALERAAALKPDVVLMDVEMPCLDGIAATAQLRQRCPQSAVVILSLHDSESARARARAAGAVAFVGKHELDAPLLSTIRLAMHAPSDA